MNPRNRPSISHAVDHSTGNPAGFEIPVLEPT